MLRPFSLERAIQAVELVRQRLLRATNALNAASVPYAVVGGHAVAAWVSRVDEAAVRNTRDVDILIRRTDLDAARNALTTAGFIYRHVAGMDVFLDGPNSSIRESVHIVFAGEYVKQGEPAPNPDVADFEDAGEYRIISLASLVQIKLTANRDKDRTHIRDLIDVGLVDHTWLAKLQPTLATRLADILANPQG